MLRPATCALLLDLLDPSPPPSPPTPFRAAWLPTVTLRLTLAPRVVAPLAGARDRDAIAPGTTFELWLGWPLGAGPDHAQEDP